MDTSKRSSKKSSSFYLGQTFFWSFDELKFQWAVILVVLFTLISGLSLKSSFDLFKYADEQAKFESYWRDPVPHTYKIEHKLRRGETFWLFTKNIKTGELYDTEVKASIFLDKNEGDTITFKSRRIDDLGYGSYNRTSGPAVKNLGSFWAIWMNSVIPIVILVIVLSMFFCDKFDITPYGKRCHFEDDNYEFSKGEVQIDCLIRNTFLLFWTATNIFVLVRGIIFANI